MRLERFMNGAAGMNKPVGYGAFFGMAVLFLLLTGWTVLFRSPEQAVVFSAADDGLYYPKLAQNLVATGRCTYDGVTRTNGFHPLWLLMLLPVYATIGDSWAALQGVYGLVAGLQLTAMGLLFAAARRLRMTAAGWAAAVWIVFLNLRSFTVFFSLLESPLSLLLLLGYFVYALRAGERRFEQPVWAGVAGLLIGLCFLARLDSFLLAVAYGVVAIGRMVRRKSCRPLVKSAGIAAVGCLLLAGPYLGYNWKCFGHLQPVSAWMKTGGFSVRESWAVMSGWVWHQLIPRVQYVLGWTTVPRVVMAGVMAGAGILFVGYLLSGPRRGRVAALAGACPEWVLFAGLHMGFIILAAPHEAAASAWYWVPQILLAGLAAGVALPDFGGAKITIVPVVVGLLVLVQLWFYPVFLGRKAMSSAKLEVARFLREHTDPSAHAAMFDSGITAYFSERNFTGLNGLIGDFEHAELMRRRAYATALERNGVDYLVLDTPAGMLDRFEPWRVYRTETVSRFENFSEEPKPFVVYKGTPAELARIWEMRYGGLR